MKTKRHILSVMLAIVLLALPVTVFAKELGLLTITGPGIKGDLSVSDSGILAQCSQVQDSAGGCGDEIEQPGIPTEVPNQSFRLDLLAKIHVGIGSQVRRPHLGVRFGIDPGKGAVSQDAIEIERLAEFAGQERVQMVEVDTAGKEICLAAPELPGTRPREQKSKTLGILVGLNLNRIQ